MDKSMNGMKMDGHMGDMKKMDGGHMNGRKDGDHTGGR